MVKLIMTDVDGTLLQEGASNLNPEYYTVIKELVDAGVVFVVGSGRPGESLKKVFTPLLDDVWFVSQNGCVIEYREEKETLRPIPTEWIKEWWGELRKRDKIEAFLETASEGYVLHENTPMADMLTDKYQVTITPLGGWDNIPEGKEYSMFVVFDPDGIEQNFCKDNEFLQKWEGKLNMTVSGFTWLDCTMGGNSKGYALLKLCEKLGIDPKDTVAFGDNMNDVTMMETAGFGCAVATAKPEVKARAKKIVPSYDEDGVLMELKRILAEIKCK